MAISKRVRFEVLRNPGWLSESKGAVSAPFVTRMRWAA